MTEKKALEVLNSWLRVAYQNADGTDEASAELYEALQTVFAIITRQQAENESLKVENQSLRSAANSLKMHYEEAQAEIERLNKEIQITKDAYTMLQTKIEIIKSEAVKEFAERLCEDRVSNDPRCYCGKMPRKRNGG